MAATLRLQGRAPVFEFSEEQLIARDAFERMLIRDVVPAIAPASRLDQFPEAMLRTWLRRLAPMGLGGWRVAVEAGGMGAHHVTAGLMHETTSRHVHALASPALINEGVALLLERTASDVIKRRYLQPLVAGERIAASANTEPGGGSDARAYTMRARKRGSCYVLNGRKSWITYAQFADFVVVTARTVEEDSLELFLVDRAAQPYSVRPLKVAGRITLAELGFDDIELPANQRLTTGGEGAAHILAAFRGTRSLVALSAVGIAQAAQELAIAYAKARMLFGKPIAATQLVQQQLADSAVDIEAARLLAYRALALADTGQSSEVASSMAKLHASEMVRRVVDRAAQIHGAAGLCEEMPIERLAQYAKVFTIVEGTSEIQRLIIGRSLTGLSAF